MLNKKDKMIIIRNKMSIVKMKGAKKKSRKSKKKYRGKMMEMKTTTREENWKCIYTSEKKKKEKRNIICVKIVTNISCCF